MPTLSGKVALVTGAGGMRSIGRAIALKLGREGADVIVSDIDRPPERIADEESRASWRGIESVADEIRNLGRRTSAIRCDLSREPEIRSLVEESVTHLGRLDILVNAARAFMKRNRVPVLEMTESEWDSIMAVNVRGPMTASRLAAQAMVRAGQGGVIINISSDSGTRPNPGSAAYATSKAALNMLTRAMGLELAPLGIRVNAICPGGVDTSRVFLDEKQRAAEAGLSYEEYRRRHLEEQGRMNAIGHVATPEDIADVAYFLASDLSRHMVGQCVTVDGGTA